MKQDKNKYALLFALTGIATAVFLWILTWFLAPLPQWLKGF